MPSTVCSIGIHKGTASRGLVTKILHEYGMDDAVLHEEEMWLYFRKPDVKLDKGSMQLVKKWDGLSIKVGHHPMGH